MSWDIVLFNSKETIRSIEDLDPDKLDPTDFVSVLESSFTTIHKEKNHREIKEKHFSIEFFTDDEPVSNKTLSLYGENGLFKLIELAKLHGWQIFDTGSGMMINLERPENNGYQNHQNFVKQAQK